MDETLSFVNVVVLLVIRSGKAKTVEHIIDGKWPRSPCFWFNNSDVHKTWPMWLIDPFCRFSQPIIHVQPCWSYYDLLVHLFIPEKLHSDHRIGTAVQGTDLVNAKDISTAFKHAEWNLATKRWTSAQYILICGKHSGPQGSEVRRCSMDIRVVNSRVKA